MHVETIAHSVSAKSWKIILPTIRKAGSQIWASYNRTKEVDPVHKLFRRELQVGVPCSCEHEGKEYTWTEYTGPDAMGIFINYSGNYFFTEENRKEMEKDRDLDYDLYLHVWLGEPESQGAYSLIKRKHVREAVGRSVDPWEYISLGVDPARYGDDDSVIAERLGLQILPLFVIHGINTMELTGRVMKIARERFAAGYKQPIKVKVDDTGIGSGVSEFFSMSRTVN